MKEWYEFNRDAIKSIMENPKQALIDFVFIAGIFGMLYVSLWIFCPC